MSVRRLFFDILKLGTRFDPTELEQAAAWLGAHRPEQLATEQEGLWIFTYPQMPGLETEILLEKRTVRELHCNCGEQRPELPCIHLLAGLLLVREAFKPQPKAPKAPQASPKLRSDHLSTLLQQTEAESLHDFIRLYVKEDKKLSAYLKISLLPDRSEREQQAQIEKQLHQFMLLRKQASGNISLSNQEEILDILAFCLKLSEQQLSRGMISRAVLYLQVLPVFDLAEIKLEFRLRCLPLVETALGRLAALAPQIHSPESIEAIREWLLEEPIFQKPIYAALAPTWADTLQAWYPGALAAGQLIARCRQLLAKPGLANKTRWALYKLLGKLLLESSEAEAWQDLLFNPDLPESLRWQMLEAATDQLATIKLEAIREILMREGLLQSDSEEARAFLASWQGPVVALKNRVSHFAKHPNRHDGKQLLLEISQLEHEADQQTLIAVLESRRLHPFISQVLAHYYAGHAEAEKLGQLLADNKDMESLIQHLDKVLLLPQAGEIIQSVVTYFLGEHFGPPANHKMHLLSLALTRNKASAELGELNTLLKEQFEQRWKDLQMMA